MLACHIPVCLTWNDVNSSSEDSGCKFDYEWHIASLLLDFTESLQGSTCVLTSFKTNGYIVEKPVNWHEM